MSFVLQVIGWVIFIYGFLSLAQDIIEEISFSKINHNMKIIVLAKNLESDLENFTKELLNLRRKNGYKNITLIDMEESDNIHNIINELEQNEINMKVLNKLDGEMYLRDFFE